MRSVHKKSKGSKKHHAKHKQPSHSKRAKGKGSVKRRHSKGSKKRSKNKKGGFGTDIGVVNTPKRTFTITINDKEPTQVENMLLRLCSADFDFKSGTTIADLSSKFTDGNTLKIKEFTLTFDADGKVVSYQKGADTPVVFASGGAQPLTLTLELNTGVGS